VAITIYADGTSKGNPGPAAGSAVVVDGDGITGRVLHVYAKRCGVATNNVAEWTGLLLALRAAVEHNIINPRIRMDSDFVVKQFWGAEVEGGFACRNETMTQFRERSLHLAKMLGTVDLQIIERKNNMIADRIGNDLLQKKIEETPNEPDIPTKRKIQEKLKNTEVLPELSLFEQPALTQTTKGRRAAEKLAAMQVKKSKKMANIIAALRFAHDYASLIAQTGNVSDTTTQIELDIKSYLFEIGGHAAIKNLQ
jgi:ribonuclease HI